MQLRKLFPAAIAALLLTGASIANAALTPANVTWNPSGAGISTAPVFTFNDVVLNTYATIDLSSSGTSFTEQGFQKLSVFTLAGAPTSIPNAGFPSGTPYSLYISFNATGTQTPGIPSSGQFTSLTYSLLGAPGVTNFMPDAAGVFSATGSAAVTLATGSLLSPGSTSLTADPGTGLLLPAAQLTASFNANPAFASFFVTPPATTPLTISAAFTSTGTIITSSALAGGGTRLSINGGGGNATVSVSAIPEPDTYGMVLAGLGLLGFISRRKAKRRDL
jgi:hypothetical protein